MRMRGLFIILVVTTVLLGNTITSWAQCETPAGANAALRDAATQEINSLNTFITNVESHIDQTVSELSTSEATQSVETFADVAVEWLNNWWQEGFQPALQGMVKELNVAQVDQSNVLGRMDDADNIIAEKIRHDGLVLESTQRYAPSAFTCEADNIGPGRSLALQTAIAFNQGVAYDNQGRQRNASTSFTAFGRATEVNLLWSEYVAMYCDSGLKEQGCTTSGAFPSQQKDIAGLLWGNRQTLDLSSPESLWNVKASLRYMIDLFGPEVIQTNALNTPEGIYSRAKRQADAAYHNTIYNTMGQMLSERIGGSKVDTRIMRASLGIPEGDSSSNASYRELQELMIQNRFRDPAYMVKMIENPAQLGREKNMIGAYQLQTMNDIYRRQEEMLFMEASGYSRDLYKTMPGTGAGSMNVRADESAD